MSTSSIERSNSVPDPQRSPPGASSIREPRMPSNVRSKTKPPGVTDPAHATPAFFVGASFWDSVPDADPDARLYDRAPHPVQIGVLERRG
jgi:hypothetical protein